jgi:IclR family KDG regulon transcriptional repressor
LTIQQPGCNNPNIHLHTNSVGGSVSTAAARVVRVLEVLAQAGRPMSVTEIGRHLGAEKSTVSRLLRDLAQHALLEREEGRGRFRLGIRLAQFARAALEGTDLRAASAPHLRSLCDQGGESVHLATLRRGQVIYVDKVEAPTFVRTSTEIGDVAPTHCTASGKAILAWLPESTALQCLGGRRLKAFTGKTITAREALLRHLHDVRAAGYAVDDEEYVEDVRCVAAPIFNHAGAVVGSVGVSGLATRIARARLLQLAAMVRDTASRISGALGNRGTEGPGKKTAPPARRVRQPRAGSRRRAV